MTDRSHFQIATLDASSHTPSRSPRSLTLMLPDFMIIGAMKAGTSSLFRYLASHPEIVPSSVKETDFFFSERNYSRGKDWYEGLFDGEGEHALEASPNYAKRHIKAGVPERICALMPDVKMVFVARDPIERLISHYVHNLDHGRERRSFSQAVADPESNYILTSRYFYQIEAFLEHFSRNQFLVVQSEALRGKTAATVATICSFLGVATDCDPEVMEQKIHPSSAKTAPSGIERLVLEATKHPGARRFIKCHTERFRKPIERPRLSEADRGWLHEALADDAEQLRSFSGQDFPGWSV